MKKLKLRAMSAALAVAALISLAIPALAVSVTDFTDVPADSWYYDYVKTACEDGLISGTSATTFSPTGTMSRGQFVTVLGRFAKVDTDSVVNTGKFTDVPDDEYYTPYIYWAADKGIVNGLTDTIFDPTADITKEQMAALLTRYAAADGGEFITDAANSSLTFGDASEISDYARDSIETLKLAGILTGDETGNVQPKKSITRAEATTMIVKFRSATIWRIPEENVPNYIDCKSINASAASRTLLPGETTQIEVTFVPENTSIDKTCTFLAINPDVATVSSTGLVTAKAVGTASFQITSSNGHTAVCGVLVRDIAAEPVDFEFEYDRWEVGTFSDSSNVGYFFITHDIIGQPVITQSRKVGIGESITMFSPYIIYSDGFKTTRAAENISIYKMSYTSSNPQLVTANANGTITVNRVIAASEGPQTVTITAHSAFINKSHTVTVTVYHQDSFTYDDTYVETFGREVVRLVNIERDKLGLNALAYDKSMQAGATLRAQERSVSYSDTRPDGTNYSTAFPGKESVNEAQFRSLNTYTNFYSPDLVAQVVVNSWLDSGEMSKILLNENARNACAGIYFVEGQLGCYATLNTAGN